MLLKTTFSLMALTLSMLASPAASKHLHMLMTRYSDFNCDIMTHIGKDGEASDFKPGKCRSFDDEPAFHSFSTAPGKHWTRMQDHVCFFSAFKEIDCKGDAVKYDNLAFSLGQCMNFADAGRSAMLTCGDYSMDAEDQHVHDTNNSATALPEDTLTTVVVTTSITELPTSTPVAQADDEVEFTEIVVLPTAAA